MYLSDDMTPEELQDAAAEQRALRIAKLPKLSDVLAAMVGAIQQRRAEGDGFNGLYPERVLAHPERPLTGQGMARRTGSGLYVPRTRLAEATFEERFRGDIRL